MSGVNVLEVLRAHRQEIRDLGAVQIGLFGSHARGDATPESDVDLLVDLDQHTFDRYMNLKLYLEDLLGRRVDLVLSDKLKPRLRQRILSEVIDAA
jgi:hypothetical protein